MENKRERNSCLYGLVLLNQDHWKIPLNKVVGILNPKLLEDRQQKVSHKLFWDEINDVAEKIRSKQQLRILLNVFVPRKYHYAAELMLTVHGDYALIGLLPLSCKIRGTYNKL